MDLLSRLIQAQQAQNARNNTNIVVQRAAALRSINSNGNPSQFLAVASYLNVVYNAPTTHIQGVQSHQQLVNEISRSTNVSNNYNSNLNNHSISNSNNNDTTQTTNNNNTNNLSNICNVNTISQSHGNNFKARNPKNSNCYSIGSKHGLNLDQNRYITSLFNTNLNNINGNHNGSFTNNNTSTNIYLVQVIISAKGTSIKIFLQQRVS